MVSTGTKVIQPKNIYICILRHPERDTLNVPHRPETTKVLYEWVLNFTLGGFQLFAAEINSIISHENRKKKKQRQQKNYVPRNHNTDGKGALSLSFSRWPTLRTLHIHIYIYINKNRKTHNTQHPSLRPTDQATNSERCEPVSLWRTRPNEWETFFSGSSTQATGVHSQQQAISLLGFVHFNVYEYRCFALVFRLRACKR